jgi:hypothetical protein
MILVDEPPQTALDNAPSDFQQWMAARAPTGGGILVVEASAPLDAGAERNE